MYKLLIVDDEEIIRRAIARILEWEGLGFSPVQQAEDGRQALAMALEEKPDLILADIQMPFMTGLEMAQALREPLPDTAVVILSGHNEFQLAQQAIGLGVMDYILKPLGAASLTRQMKEIRVRLDARRRETEYLVKARSRLRQSLPVLRESCLNALVCAPGGARDALRRLEQLECPLETGPFTVCVIEPEPDRMPPEDAELHAFAVKNITMESLGERHPVFSDPQGRIVAVVCHGALPPGSEPREMVPEILEVIRNSVGVFLGTSATVGLGTTAATAEDLHASWLEALAALECKYTLGTGHIFNVYDLDYLDTEFIYPFDACNAFLAHLRTLSPDGSARDLADIGRALRTHKASPANCKLVWIQLVTELLKLLAETQTDAPALWQEGLALFTALERSHSMEANLAILEPYTRKVARALSEARAKSTTSLVAKAKAFVDAQFARDDLSLETAAAHINVSPGYLSALFKKEAGVNFIDYLTRVRMEQAMTLLRTTDLRGYEIADRIGYANPHYFSVAFRKYTGRSPSEFKGVTDGGADTGPAGGPAGRPTGGADT